MSAFGDAMKAVKDVILMQASIERLDEDFQRLTDDVRGAKDAIVDLDKRLVRIETLVEMSGGGRGGQPPRLEG